MAKKFNGRTYRVRAGVHYGDGGKEYKKGDIITTTYPLDQMFVNKFQDITHEVDDVEEKEEVKKPAPKTSNEPVDVSKDFGLDDDDPIKVLKEGTKFNVYSTDGDESELKNDAPLTKAKADELVDELLDAEDE